MRVGPVGPVSGNSAIWSRRPAISRSQATSTPHFISMSYFPLSRVVDATRLKGKYDIDMKWGVDVAWLLEMAGRRDQIAELPDTGPTGPTLIRAVQDQLGLKLNSKKGLGDFVVVDHVEKVPTEN